MSGDLPNVHASCVLVGASGVLLRGGSGIGKSRLGDLLVARAARRGTLQPMSRMTGWSSRSSMAGSWPGRLGPCPACGSAAGRASAGCRPEPRALLRLIVDLERVSDIERMPEETASGETLLGVPLPRVVLAGEAPHLAALRIMTRLGKA